MPSVSAIQIKTGSPAPPPAPSTDCEELGKKNKERREELNGKSADKQVVGDPKGSGRGTTVSSSKSSTGGRPRFRSAHNNQKAYNRCEETLEGGGSDSVREGTAKTLCGYMHPDPAIQKSGHAEARLLDGLKGRTKPSQITFNIDWRKRKGRASKMPCKTCHQYMCKVQEDCDVEMFLCDKKGAKQPVPCPPTRGNRKALKKKIDGRR